MKKQQEFKIVKKMDLWGRILRGSCYLYKKKPKIINLNDDYWPQKSILICNHVGESAPYHFYAFINKRVMAWGMHEMTLNFKERYKFLYHDFYRGIHKYNKLKSWFYAWGVAVLNPMCYKRCGVIPTYHDERLISTFKNSIACLENDIPILIFPEDLYANSECKEKIEKAYMGFLTLSKMYYQKYKVDLPIYTLHYSRKPKRFVIGKPMYYQELIKEHGDDVSILKVFIDYMNSLGDIPLPNKKKKDK